MGVDLLKVLFVLEGTTLCLCVKWPLWILQSVFCEKGIHSDQLYCYLLMFVLDGGVKCLCMFVLLLELGVCWHGLSTLFLCYLVVGFGATMLGCA